MAKPRKIELAPLTVLLEEEDLVVLVVDPTPFPLPFVSDSFRPDSKPVNLSAEPGSGLTSNPIMTTCVPAMACTDKPSVSFLTLILQID